MKKLIPILAAQAPSLVLSGYAVAKDKADKPVRGKITSITKDEKKAGARRRSSPPAERTIRTRLRSSWTKPWLVTVDGQAAKLADLAEGERVPDPRRRQDRLPDWRSGDHQRTQIHGRCSASAGNPAQCGGQKIIFLANHKSLRPFGGNVDGSFRAPASKCFP